MLSLDSFGTIINKIGLTTNSDLNVIEVLTTFQELLRNISFVALYLNFEVLKNKAVPSFIAISSVVDDSSTVCSLTSSSLFCCSKSVDI